MDNDCYQQISTMTERFLLDRLCCLLEDANIPVLVEHGGLNDDMRHLFKILVPSRCFQQAAHFVESINSYNRAAVGI